MADPAQMNIRPILAELRDTNKTKRRTAVMKLGMLGGDEAVRALIRVLDNQTEDLIVRSRAALMLGKLGDMRAVEPLIRALDTRGYQMSLNAVESLAALGDTRAIGPLRILASNSTDRLQDASLDALERLGWVETEVRQENDRDSRTDNGDTADIPDPLVEDRNTSPEVPHPELN